MAKIFFVGLDGTEKSYRLQTHRPFTVGRDPGNDIILRDPKVSRHHSEIVFERGFFVLHDLASANGTYVNGKRIRVAPLTHGARLRMGNTYGRFSEELPTESEASPIAAAEPFDQPAPPTEDLSNLEIVPVETLPHEKLAPADLKKKIEVEEGPTEPINPAPPTPPAGSGQRAAGGAGPAPSPPIGPFSSLRYHFTTGLRSGETAYIRDDHGQVLLSYRAFASVIGIVATLVAGIVFVAGLAATAFLVNEHAPLRAIIALILTIVFALLITRLVPRVSVTLYDDGNPALTISQRAAATYVVAAPNGTILGRLRKSPFSFLGRARWTITHDGRVLAEAIEESFGRALLRKLYGKFSRRFEANLFIRLPGIDMGRILRRDEDVLELTGDALDRRVAVALATVVFGREP